MNILKFRTINFSGWLTQCYIFWAQLLQFCKDAGKVSCLSYDEVDTNTDSTLKKYENTNGLKKQTSK